MRSADSSQAQLPRQPLRVPRGAHLGVEAVRFAEKALALGQLAAQSGELAAALSDLRRQHASTGLGYEWLKRKRITWGVSATGGFQYTDLVSAEAGASTTSNDGVVILGTTIETDPTSDIEWDTVYSVQVVPADTGRTNHHLESIFSIDLFFDLDFDVTFIWDRIEDPAADADGVVPEQNDYRLTFGLGWDF